MRRVSWQLPAAAVLLALLAILATFQYRWLGEVSQAESERMRATLRTRPSDFTQEFDRELSRTYLSFQITPRRFDAGAVQAIGEAYQRWQAAAPVAGLIRAVYLVEGATFDNAGLRRLDPAHGMLEPIEWPADLAASLKHREQALPQIIGTVPMPMFAADAVNAQALTLVVPLARLSSVPTDRQLPPIADIASGRVVVVQFDADALQQFLHLLVAKNFGDATASEYVVTVASREAPAATIFTTAGGPLSAAAADVTSNFFGLRLDDVSRLAVATMAPPASDRPIRTEHMAITIVRRGGSADPTRTLVSAADDRGAWQVRVRHRDGSLEAVVARSRRRNLAISLSVLGLLGASFVLAMAASRRQQRLAQQQMEFVASVSHELRTPLAVICSAGENLADGVVAETEQVKTYGSLIESEGRRLGDMVERVLEFAGISAGSTVRMRSDVCLRAVVDAAVQEVGAEARERGVTINLDAGDALPAIAADPDALRSAIQNVVGNAIKYSPAGSRVDVLVRAENHEARIDVVDRGFGIDAADVPHIFKPFFRGRRALDSQARGSGVGLSVVRHVIDLHRGRIVVDSRVGVGTTVRLVLPALEQRVADVPAP